MKYFALLTKLGENLLAQATALGTKIELTHMAVGDGGGKLPTPDTNQTKLISEKRRAAINTLFIDDKNKNQIIAEQIIPEQDGGWWIREIGLFDKDGNLIAVANCPETYKPQLAEGSGRTQSIRMVLIVSHTESVTLKIDPSVVLATRAFVDDSVKRGIEEHEKSRKHPDASTTAKGFVQLADTLSADNTKAITPKLAAEINQRATNAQTTANTANTNATNANNNANNRVPNTRKVNNKPLSTDINLTASDVGAYDKSESDNRFQPKGNYAPAGNYQPAGDYATNEALKNTTSETIFARAIAIPLNSDLNNYLTPGLYFQPNGSPGTNGKNYPSNTAGSLEVIKTGNSSVKQVYTAWYDNKTWVRRYNGGNKTWADKWDEDFTALNPPTSDDVGAYSTQQADAKFQLKGDYLDKGSTQEQITKGFLTASRRLSVEAPDKARAILYAVESGNVGISAQDSTGKWLGDIKHPANGKNGTLAIVEQLIGEGQKWVDVTSQRQSRVTYTNETSRPILVCVSAYGEAHDVHFLVNDTVVALIGYNSITTIARPLSVIIPAGAKYRISDTIGYTYTWSELR
ncbi:phage tail protein [Providencia stuartii]|uniref:phage tail-collar fiber domain-containing protein n=1 Tax=Providencia stuartii TaxID=588 RepID=UPI0023E22358|nr:phage tail protein [Providencia stuartii]ELR5143314.1 phage tail protein [Providencia stuartii]WER20921.1 phage tail protein [Providencia stuartii]WER25041.1 phage tail protein [Providencia stuartii]WER29131.1 phage tail protein [Providencia stuartii]